MVFNTVVLGAALASIHTANLAVAHSGLYAPVVALDYSGAPPARALRSVQTQNAFNPDISAVFRFESRLADTMNPPMRRSALRELELGIAGDVDPYMRTEAYVSFTQSIDGGENEAAAEEAFGIYSGLTPGLEVKVGKFAGAVGRIGRNHPDQLEFMSFPLVVTEVMGEDAFRAPGLSASYLLRGARFNEVTFEVIAPEEGALFGPGDAGNPAWIAHYRTFFDFTKDFSGQLGLSHMTGHKDGGTSHITGLDFVGKLRPEGTGKSLFLESEAYTYEASTPGSESRFGYFASASYQMSKELWAGLKYDDVQLPDGSDTLRQYTAGLTYHFTEFDHVRLEFRRLLSDAGNDRTQIQLQFQWVIGPHKPHKY